MEGDEAALAASLVPRLLAVRALVSDEGLGEMVSKPPDGEVI